MFKSSLSKHSKQLYSPFRASYSVSPLLDFRRQKERKQWQLPADPDAEFTTFPNVSLGRNYELNWEFNGYQVTPSEYAFRNLHLRGLQMFAPGKIDKTNAINISTEEPKDHKIFYLPSDKLTNQENIVTSDVWKATIRQVRMELSFEPKLFMHDGVIGSSRNASLNSRLILNSPLAALHLHHIMSPIPKCQPGKFPHDITGWMIETNELNIPKQYNIDTNNYTLVDLDNKRFIVVGKLSQNVIKKSLLASSAYEFSNKDSLLLNCDSILQGNDSGLVFSIGGSPVSIKESLNVYSAKNTIWSPNGLVRVWDSISYDHVPKQVNRGDLKEKIGSVTRFTTKLPNTAGPTVSHPKVVIFVDNKLKSSAITKLTKPKLQQILPTIISDEATRTKLEELITSKSTKCYLIGNKNTKDLTTQITATFNK